MTEILTVLGSTGSIGTQSLEIARKLGIKVSSLAAGSNIELLEKQVREFSPKTVAVVNEEKAKKLKLNIADTFTRVLSGEEGVIEAATESKSDTVLNAVVGIAGLKPTIAAIESKKTLALANKETLVTAGDIVNAKLKEYNVKMFPVDSEHSAIFQSLQGVPDNSVERIVLTASGGPFFGKTKEELKAVTVKEALNHPNWSMGKKITIDSATLMNKGLEVIEAVHLFGLDESKIDVYIHRQSIVHSGIELKDGAIITQMGIPDMKLPIQYALTYPNRYECFGRLDLFKANTLTFERPDEETFRCLKICKQAIRFGGLKPAAANGANEAAVDLFLNGKIGFLEIAEMVEAATNAENRSGKYTLEDVFDADKKAREKVYGIYENMR